MAASGPDAKKTAGAASPAVRFASVNEEIAPAETLQSLDSLSTPAAGDDADAAGGAQQLKQLSESLQGTHLQERRMSHFAFEPVSLPVSRVRLFPPFHFIVVFLCSGRCCLDGYTFARMWTMPCRFITEQLFGLPNPKRIILSTESIVLSLIYGVLLC
jgi:hypothetical protein